MAVEYVVECEYCGNEFLSHKFLCSFCGSFTAKYYAFLAPDAEQFAETPNEKLIKAALLLGTLKEELKGAISDSAQPGQVPPTKRPLESQEQEIFNIYAFAIQNLGLTDYRTDSTFTTVDGKNNQNFGGTIGYEYYFAPNHNLKLNIGQNEYEARLDVYGYQNQSKNVSYTNNFKSINYSLTRSLNYNLYDKADTFIKSDTIRDDKIKTDTLSIFGNFDSLLKAEKYSFLKNLFYNLSYSKINSESNIINFDYKKELFKFGLTKRVVF